MGVNLSQNRPMEENKLLQITGMTCSNCALGVSRYLEKQGLIDVNVDFVTGEVRYDTSKPPDFDKLKKGINNLGYQLITGDIDEGLLASNSNGFTLEKKLYISAIFTFPLLMHMFFSLPILHNAMFQLIMAGPVFTIGMIHFGKSALASLKTGIPNMDVLITIGAAAAFIYSIAGWILNYGTEGVSNYLFFETSATIITLVLLGNYIEKRSVNQTTTAIRQLVSMQPLKATQIIISSDKKEIHEVIDVKIIKKGDALLINSGEQIPADGTIYFGNGTIDESMITGESIPKDKKVGDLIFSGTLILEGSVKMVVEKAGSQTALSNIIELVKNASSKKPTIQKLGDKISAWFVPSVVLISIATFLVNFFFFDVTITSSIMRAIAVLVISCPCAMGLAAPTAVAVGIGRAARNGILIKGGNTLEMFHGIKTAVFDKTGTLTTGKFTVDKLITYSLPESEVINLIVSIEQHSSHPIAKSILDNFSSKATDFIEFSKIDEIKGAGIIAIDKNKNIYKLGSHAFHPENDFESGHQIYLSKNNKLIGAIDIKDSVRPRAKELITGLKKMGIKPVLLSGDSTERCEDVAKQTGIEIIYASKLPHEKSELIDSLKKAGRLLKVGDGINDAPSLVKSDIGISFSDASKIAINSASVILLKPDEINLVLSALQLGTKTLQTIKQNFFWAFFYNIVAIPIAAIGLLNPMVAALSMALSDVVVIGNSIRLNYRKINGPK